MVRYYMQICAVWCQVEKRMQCTQVMDFFFQSIVGLQKQCILILILLFAICLQIKLQSNSREKQFHELFQLSHCRKNSVTELQTGLLSAFINPIYMTRGIFPYLVEESLSIIIVCCNQGLKWAGTFQRHSVTFS